MAYSFSVGDRVRIDPRLSREDFIAAQRSGGAGVSRDMELVFEADRHGVYTVHDMDGEDRVSLKRDRFEVNEWTYMTSVLVPASEFASRHATTKIAALLARLQNDNDEVRLTVEGLTEGRHDAQIDAIFDALIALFPAGSQREIDIGQCLKSSCPVLLVRNVHPARLCVFNTDSAHDGRGEILTFPEFIEFVVEFARIRREQFDAAPKNLTEIIASVKFDYNPKTALLRIGEFQFSSPKNLALLKTFVASIPDPK